MPLDMVGEHAQEDVGAHPVGQPVVDRPDLEVDRLHAAERPFDKGERLVGADGTGIVEGRDGQAGAHHVEAVEGGLGGDRCRLAGEAEASSVMVISKCLAILCRPRTAPTLRPILAAPLSG